DQSVKQIRTAEEEIQFLIRTFDSDKKPVARDVADFVASTALFDALYLVNAGKAVRVISVKDKEQGLANTLYKGADLSHSELFSDERSTVRPYWSDAFLSLITARLSIAHVVPLDNGTLVA